MSSFSKQVEAAIAQLLASLRPDVVYVLLAKHFDDPPTYGWNGVQAYLLHIQRSSDVEVRNLLVELMTNTRAIRADAPTKYVFEDRLRDLEAWLRHDGWRVEDGALVRETPAIEEATMVRDLLIETLERSPLDAEGKIREQIRKAAEDFVTDPPDLNSSTTHVRVALETIARSGAATIAARVQDPLPDDRWGAALTYLRQWQILTPDAEKGIAAAYSFISDGAHVPKGLSDLEWARLVRTIALSMAYFLVQVIVAAL
jgi:hypothetical protein